jgi:hypothetical protein
MPDGGFRKGTGPLTRATALQLTFAAVFLDLKLREIDANTYARNPRAIPPERFNFIA